MFNELLGQFGDQRSRSLKRLSPVTNSSFLTRTCMGSVHRSTSMRSI